MNQSMKYHSNKDNQKQSKKKHIPIISNNSHYKKKNNTTTRKNDLNNKGKILDIPGFYYDAEKNRYFPIGNNHTKRFSDYLQTQSNKSTKENSYSNLLKAQALSSPPIHSYFHLIHYHKYISKATLNKHLIRSHLIKKTHTFTSFEDIRSDQMLIFQNKYFIYKEPLHTQFGSVISFIKPNNNQFLKKIYINIDNEPIDKITLINEHLICYQNWTITFIISPSLDNWLHNNSNIITTTQLKQSKISLILTQPFSFRKNIRNVHKLPMEFNWPIVKESKFYTNRFYALIYQNFFILKTSNKSIPPIQKCSNETLCLNKSDFLNPIFLYINHYFHKNKFSDFILVDEDEELLMFEMNGSVIKYDLSTYEAKMTIEHDYMSIVTFTYELYEDVYVVMTEKHNVLIFNSVTNEIQVIYKAKHGNYLQFAMNKIWCCFPYVYFQNENRELVQYSIELLEMIEVFKLRYHKHNLISVDDGDDACNVLLDIQL